MAAEPQNDGIDLRPPAVFAARLLLTVGFATAAGGAVGLWVDSDDGFIAGFLLIGVGCLTGWMASAGEYPAARSAVLLHLATGLALLILSWGSNKHPVSFDPPLVRVLGTLCPIAIARPTWRAWSRRPAHVDPPGVCRECGYILRGLTTPRCPECGRPFDPAELTA